MGKHQKKRSQSQSPCSSVRSPMIAAGDTISHSLVSNSFTLICLIPFRPVCGSCHSQVPLARFCHQMVPPIALMASRFYYRPEHPLKGPLNHFLLPILISSLRLTYRDLQAPHFSAILKQDKIHKLSKSKLIPLKFPKTLQ